MNTVFANLAASWWDPNGSFKTLHDINPTRLAWIQKFIKLENMRILDLGCGGGILTEALALSGARMTGLDIETDLINIAKNHADLNNIKNLEYICESIENYKTELFDAIVCMEMLEHVEDYENILKNALKLLKPGGYLFLSTINRTLAAYLGVILAGEYILRILPKQTHEFKKFLKPSELANTLRSLECDIINLSGMKYNPITRKSSLENFVGINYLLAARKV